ncbi:MAG: replication initiation factor domain-containing protein [Thalassotalea sp.]
MKQLNSKIITTPTKATQLKHNALLQGRSVANITDQSTVTDCSFLTNSNIKSRIDYFIANIEIIDKADFDILYELLNGWLIKIGIDRSKTKPLLKHFDDGKLLVTALSAYAEVCGALKWDHDKKILRLELSGLGCGFVNAHEGYFYGLLNAIGERHLIIKRLDIALDEFEDKYGIRFVDQSYSKGLYNPIIWKNSKNKKPKKKNLNEDNARTRIIGSFKSNKYMVIYEKGKQLGFDKNHPLFNWIRHELRLKGTKDYTIPIEALFSPDKYFVGAYERVNQRLISNCPPRCIKKEYIVSTDKILSQKIGYARKQVGPTIALATQRLNNDEIINAIERPSKKQTVYPPFISADELAAIPYLG